MLKIITPIIIILLLLSKAIADEPPILSTSSIPSRQSNPYFAGINISNINYGVHAGRFFGNSFSVELAMLSDIYKYNATEITDSQNTTYKLVANSGVSGELGFSYRILGSAVYLKSSLSRRSSGNKVKYLNSSFKANNTYYGGTVGIAIDTKSNIPGEYISMEFFYKFPSKMSVNFSSAVDDKFRNDYIKKFKDYSGLGVKISFGYKF